MVEVVVLCHRPIRKSGLQATKVLNPDPRYVICAVRQSFTNQERQTEDMNIFRWRRLARERARANIGIIRDSGFVLDRVMYTIWQVQG